MYLYVHMQYQSIVAWLTKLVPFIKLNVIDKCDFHYHNLINVHVRVGH